MEPTGRHAEKPQDVSQREIRARPIHGAQDPPLGAPVRQTRSCEAELGGSEQGEGEPEQRRTLVDASPQLQDLRSELRLREVRNIRADHDLGRRAQPATRRRARHSEVRGDRHVPGALDKIPKPVVVALLQAGRRRHGNDDRLFPGGTQLLKHDGSERAEVTTTRTAKCRMSVRTARFSCWHRSLARNTIAAAVLSTSRSGL
jgi:hypothetical protein